MRCQGQTCSHLICIALHPLCSHLYTSLSPLVSVLFILNSTLPCTPLTLSPGDWEWEENGIFSCWPEAIVSLPVPTSPGGLQSGGSQASTVAATPPPWLTSKAL